MKPTFSGLRTLALALLLISPAISRADLIPWMYNWSRSPSDIPADAPGTGYISLTDESLKGAIGDSDIVATNLRTHSTADPSNPDVFTNKPYSLTLFLVDVASGENGTMTFTGVINGTLSAQNSILQNTFTGVITQQLLLGDNLYTATIGPYTPPGPPNSSNAGSISAHAIITVDQLVPQGLPEPGSLILAAVGATVASAAGWRSRRRRSNRVRRVG